MTSHRKEQQRFDRRMRYMVRCEAIHGIAGRHPLTRVVYVRFGRRIVRMYQVR